MRFPRLHMRRCLRANKLRRSWCRCALTAGMLLTGLRMAHADDLMDHPLDKVLKALDLKTDIGEAPEFVRQSRPKTEGDFVPVGAQHPARTIKVKTPAELKAMTADLDAARIRHDKIAGRKPPPELPVKKPPAPGPATTQN